MVKEKKLYLLDIPFNATCATNMLKDACSKETGWFVNPFMCSESYLPEQWLKSQNAWTMNDCHPLSECELIPKKWFDPIYEEPFCPNEAHEGLKKENDAKPIAKKNK